jgi:hypothetical protein
LSICQEINNERMCVQAIALAAEVLGRLDTRRLEAIQLAAAFTLLKKELSVFLEPQEYLALRLVMDKIKVVVEPEIYDEAWERGKKMSKETALAFARGNLR